jgi:hypothetical protein
MEDFMPHGRGMIIPPARSKNRRAQRLDILRTEYWFDLKRADLNDLTID